MKKFERFVQYANKLEAFQADRRSKEVDEARRLESQLERYRQWRLTQLDLFDYKQTVEYVQRLETPDISEQEVIEAQSSRLLASEAFDLEGQACQLAASGSDFDIITELLEDGDAEQSLQELKQLPPVAEDMFRHDMTDVIDVEFERELDENEKAINSLKAPSTRLEVMPPKETRPAAVTNVPANEAVPPTTEGATPSAAAPEEPAPAQKKTGNVFFLRSTPNFRDDN